MVQLFKRYVAHDSPLVYRFLLSLNRIRSELSTKTAYFQTVGLLFVFTHALQCLQLPGTFRGKRLPESGAESSDAGSFCTDLCFAGGHYAVRRSILQYPSPSMDALGGDPLHRSFRNPVCRVRQRHTASVLPARDSVKGNCPKLHSQLCIPRHRGECAVFDKGRPEDCSADVPEQRVCPPQLRRHARIGKKFFQKYGCLPSERNHAVSRFPDSDGQRRIQH